MCSFSAFEASMGEIIVVPSFLVVYLETVTVGMISLVTIPLMKTDKFNIHFEVLLNPSMKRDLTSLKKLCTIICSVSRGKFQVDC